MELKTPTPLKSEHEALYAEITAAGKFEDRTGKAARWWPGCWSGTSPWKMNLCSRPWACCRPWLRER